MYSYVFYNVLNVIYKFYKPKEYKNVYTFFRNFYSKLWNKSSSEQILSNLSSADIILITPYYIQLCISGIVVYKFYKAKEYKIAYTYFRNFYSKLWNKSSCERRLSNLTSTNIILVALYYGHLFSIMLFICYLKLKRLTLFMHFLGIFISRCE